MKVTLSSKLRRALLAVLISAVAISATTQAATQRYVDKVKKTGAYRINSTAWGGPDATISMTNTSAWTSAITITDIANSSGNAYIATLDAYNGTTTYSSLAGIGYNYDGTTLSILAGAYNYNGGTAGTSPWKVSADILGGLPITSDTVLTIFWTHYGAGFNIYYSIDGGAATQLATLTGNSAFGSYNVTGFNIQDKGPGTTWVPASTSAGNFNTAQTAVYSGAGITQAEMNRYSAVQIGDVVRGAYSMVAGDGSMTFEGMTAAGNLTVNSGNSAIFKAAAGGQLTVAGTGNVTVSAGATAVFDKVTMTGTGNLSLNGDTTIAGTSTLRHVIFASDKKLTVTGDTTITESAVLYNVNLGAGATIMLSGAANSIASISGAAGLGNTVSLAAGITNVSGVVKGVDFTGTGVASLQGASTVWAAGGLGSATDAFAMMPSMTVDATATIITVVLSDAFMAHFFTNPSPNTVVELAQLTLAGLELGATDTVTVNLATVNGYMVTEEDGTTPWSMSVTGTDGSIVLSGKNIALTYVPEPTTATLGVLGLAGLLLRRRRKA